MRIQARVVDPSRKALSWRTRWEGPDHGLIACWERGIERAKESAELAAAALRGELVLLPWKGGVDRPTKLGAKYGSLFYLAMWQGLRGEPLDIETKSDVALTCSRTGMVVTYTSDTAKYSQQVDHD
jgi:hypothetical protein